MTKIDYPACYAFIIKINELDDDDEADFAFAKSPMVAWLSKSTSSALIARRDALKADNSVFKNVIVALEEDALELAKRTDLVVHTLGTTKQVTHHVFAKSDNMPPGLIKAID
jgi:hypothetical protein